jgi:hypothetical protein
MTYNNVNKEFVIMAEANVNLSASLSLKSKSNPVSE